MNWLDFIASIVGSIAWPLVFVAAFVFLRKPIRDLLPLLQRFKYKEIELEFARRVEEVSDEVAQELPAIPNAGPGDVEKISKVAALAERSPRAAVLEAWLLVEIKVAEAARRLGWEAPSQKASNGSYAFKFIERQPQLDRRIVGTLRDLRSLRNQAVHLSEFALTPSAALDYATSAARVATYLDSVTINPH